MATDPTKPENQVLVDAVRANGREIAVQGREVVVMNPITGVLQPIPEAAPKTLHFIEQKPTFRDVKSFIAYVNRFKDARAQLFADERKGTIAAVFDYHSTEEDAEFAGEIGIPMRCAHVATFTAEAPQEWKEWKALDGKGQSQEAFATFIENQAPFIVRPDAATMFEIARQLQASAGYQFSKVTRLDNGQVDFSYVENIEGRVGPKGSLPVPKDFDVTLAPFVGCERRQVTARLRYRIDGGSLLLWFDLFRTDDIQRAAFEGILSKVQDEVGIAPYIGAP